MFSILTNTPGGIGVLIGGRLADTRGRRVVGAVGIAGGVGLTVAMVLASGWSMWGLSLLGAVIRAVTIPALGVYGPAMCPTYLRGRAKVVTAVHGVAGSVTGFVAAAHTPVTRVGAEPAHAYVPRCFG